MRYSSRNLPDNILERMNKSDKPKGVAGMTLCEVFKKEEKVREGELHKQISNYLRLKGIPFGHSRFGVKSTYTEGWPDYTVFIHGVPILMEVKTGTNDLEDEQRRLKNELEKFGARYFIVRSLDAVRIILQEYGFHDSVHS